MDHNVLDPRLGQLPSVPLQPRQAKSNSGGNTITTTAAQAA